MSNQDNLSKIRAIYDNRASKYDHEPNHHFRQALDYIKWMSLSPGQNVLDLACGTGNVTIPAKQAVGPSGKVIGIDISGGSLVVAADKAKKLGIEIDFVEHDISDLEGVNGIKEGYFDVITCAAALVLIEDPGNAVKNWSRLLKKGGKLIFDVETPDSNIKAVVLNRVAKELGYPVTFDRSKLDTPEKVKKLLTDAGLDASESFRSPDYGGGEIYAVEDAGKIFDGLAGKNNMYESWYSTIKEGDNGKAARETFVRECGKLSSPDGKVHDHLTFLMAVGRKDV
ncbi:S-adenosyl-L-methionine-dependent methyltransferase [Halenospora varia]|nr:S-adenosyl-L-methionine-dependent methyltransferase [Halenospora varia]